VAFDLHIYCEVVGAQKTKVINRAVRELIDRDLEDNRGFRQRFDEMRGRQIEHERERREAGGALRVVKGSSPVTSARKRKRSKHDQ